MINTQSLINTITQSSNELFTKNDIIRLINDMALNSQLEKITSEGLILDPESHTVIKDSVTHKLPKRLFSLLYYLISNKNKVIRRERILSNVWGSDVVVGDRTIDVHIRKIRSIFGDENLRTVKCIGYGWFEKINLEVPKNNLTFTI